jgi:hypothetical protein
MLLVGYQFGAWITVFAVCGRKKRLIAYLNLVISIIPFNNYCYESIGIPPIQHVYFPRMDVINIPNFHSFFGKRWMNQENLLECPEISISIEFKTYSRVFRLDIRVVQ